MVLVLVTWGRTTVPEDKATPYTRGNTVLFIPPPAKRHKSRNSGLVGTVRVLRSRKCPCNFLPERGRG